MYCEDYGNNSKVRLKKNVEKFSCKIEGENNYVQLDTEGKINELKVTIEGNNNKIHISSGVIVVEKLTIYVGGNNITIEIGEKTTFANVYIHYLEDGTSLLIGKDCMFSEGIDIWGSDMHSIIDQNSAEVVNCAESIEIGNHCWFGAHCMIMKNIRVGSGSIVAAGAVVTSDVASGSIVAGVPAKEIRKGILWSRESPQKMSRKKISNFSNIKSLDSLLTNVDVYFDENRMIYGWTFLKGKDSSKQKVFLEFLMDKGERFTIVTNQERRDDVKAAYIDEECADAGFSLEVPEYIEKNRVKELKIIVQYNRLIVGKKVEI